MKVGTPFGEFPFEFRRVERRADSIAIVGKVAGLDSSVVFDHTDARRAAKVLLVPVAVGVVLAARGRRR